MNLHQQKSLLGDKTQWREHFRKILQQTAPQSSVQIHQHICENLSKYLQDKAGVWAGYLPLHQEPDLNPVYQQTRNIRWAFPRMEAEHLSFYISQNFIKGPFGVMEPSGDSLKVHLDELAGVLVPGLGFNKKGHRLGRGKGFYDRALESYSGLKVGVCFDCQVEEEDLPMEQHDVRVETIVTEVEFITCS